MSSHHWFPSKQVQYFGLTNSNPGIASFEVGDLRFFISRSAIRLVMNGCKKIYWNSVNSENVDDSAVSYKQIYYICGNMENSPFRQLQSRPKLVQNLSVSSIIGYLPALGPSGTSASTRKPREIRMKRQFLQVGLDWQRVKVADKKCSRPFLKSSW